MRHQYIETLDLSNMISITDDNSPDRNLDASRLNLQMRDGNIKFTVRQFIRNIYSFFDFITVKFLHFSFFLSSDRPHRCQVQRPGSCGRASSTPWQRSVASDSLNRAT